MVSSFFVRYSYVIDCDQSIFNYNTIILSLFQLSLNRRMDNDNTETLHILLGIRDTKILPAEQLECRAYMREATNRNVKNNHLVVLQNVGPSVSSGISLVFALVGCVLKLVLLTV